MQQYKYIKPTKNKLESQGFKYNKGFSEEDEEAYILYAPVFRWGTYVTLVARILVYIPSGLTKIDILDNSDHALYAPWYSYDYGDFEPLLDTINDNLVKQLEKLNIKYKKDCKLYE